MKNSNIGNIAIFVLLGTIAFSAVAYVGFVASPFSDYLKVNMTLDPRHEVMQVGDTFSVNVVVESNIAVNVFAGNVYFNPEVVSVHSIDYNTSIADLWAELPWYSNGDGIVNFAGGTTAQGGFVGKGNLLTITFTAHHPGNVNLTINDARILIHDGLGTDAQLEAPIDTIVTVTDPNTTQEILNKDDRASLLIIPAQAQTDLNNDGKQTIADISIFMIHFASNNLQSDFNQDGKVNIADLSILMEAE